MRKILTVVGARPQFIKAAVVSHALAGKAEEYIVHTGQHYDADMSEVFFTEMDIPHPHRNLGIHGETHSVATARMLEGISHLLEEVKPDWVLIYGDTNSTLAGALAGVQHGIPVAHVEAGMRSENLAMPEEINRVLADRISSLLLCSTDSALQNLKTEGVSSHSYMRMLVVGDVMYDAALHYLPYARPPATELPAAFNLCTLHRAELLQSPEALTETLHALDSIARTDLPVLIPLHPHTQAVLRNMGYNFSRNACTFISPTSYFETLWLIQHAHVILTDSGGLQREAYFLNKPSVILRDETEWRELAAHGLTQLAGTDYERILACYHTMKDFSFDNASTQFFGDGHAGEKIVEQLLQ